MDRAPSTDGSSPYGYDIDWQKAADFIKKSGASRIGLQAPEGLKRALPAFAARIEEETGAEAIISADPCFGACDVDTELCHEVDLMLHIGHAELGAEMEKAPQNVIFLEAAMRADLHEIAEKACRALRAKTVGVCTTIQHVHKIDQAVLALKEHGIRGLIGPAGGRIRYPGQVLGCSYASASVLDAEEYLFIGTGRFHPLGMALATGKRVVAADPVTGDVEEIDTDPLLRSRFAAICRAGQACSFAVLVSRKPGQKRMKLAERIKAMGVAAGKEMFLVYLEDIEPDRLLNLGAEAAVCTACPRVALDDAAKYRIAVLTPPEFEIMLGKRRWEDYKFDEIETE